MSCDDKNRLQREGTSELTRVLAALNVSFSRVDERDAADLLLFAKRYAAFLNYYNADNTPDGDWEVFMKMDISVTLATLVKIDVRKISDYRKLIYKGIRDSANDAEAVTMFKFVFDLLFTLVRIIDEQYSLINSGSETKSLIRNSIEGKMQQAFLVIDTLFEEFITEGWINLSQNILDAEAPINIRSCSDFDSADLLNKAEWGIPPLEPVITGITLPGAPTARENILCIINHNIFNAQIDFLLKGITEIIHHAGKEFENTINTFPAHTPHYALFITFVKLFRHAQDELNKFTQKHLDFYFKDVLQLINKPAIADSAHVVLELQKPIDKHLVEKDTLFKGGKDIIGKEISYALSEDIVLNKAVIAAIHSQQLIQSSGVLQASPVADSGDGLGGPLSSSDQSWFTFGDVKKAPFAKSGFAIASNLFFLLEGRRTVGITVRFEKPIVKPTPPKTPIHSFRAELTAEKGWHTVENVQLHIVNQDSGQLFIFLFSLSPDDPPIVPYSEAIHKEGVLTDLPFVKLILKQDQAGSLAYAKLHDKSIQSIDITIAVVGLKDLALSNDNGDVDGSKPFKPFGDLPGRGSSFYIGSRELFQKPLERVSFIFDWKNEPIPDTSGSSYFSPARYLRQSKWNESYQITNDEIVFNATAPFVKAAINFEPEEQLQQNTREGFLRLQLSSDRHSIATHMRSIRNHLNDFSILENSSDPKRLELVVDSDPPTPPEIVLDSFSINYLAKSTISFNEGSLPGNDQFFHVGPFGYKMIHPLLFDSAPNAEQLNPRTLVPHVIHEGSLMVGIDKAAPTLVINILFQVAEGSSNPLKDVQPVRWYYLSANNSWRSFDKQQIIDRTKNLTQSGIVTVTIPPDASSKNSIVKDGYVWIKAAVDKNADAVCKMTRIIAQAAKVVLVQDDTNNIEFRKFLPAKSISKLVVSDASIKAIDQPFDSFGGRVKETDEHFYLRVSERLRHKQRAISIWDYEHIVLEQFPEIFKVKCLNHAGIYTMKGLEHFCENYPGHVTIVTIPDLKDKTNINPLRPYTPIGVLKNIQDYLETVISPFVNLHVRNPAFEEIQLDFEVKFHNNLDESFYLQLLNMEIEKFLCPWAFDASAEISFGGKIRKSAILNFIEERSYVDYVTCFTMKQVVERSGSSIIREMADIEVAEGSTSRSILVSYYDEETATRHLIKSPASCDC